MEELANVVLAATCNVNVTIEEVYEGRCVPYSTVVYLVREDSPLQGRARRGLIDLSKWPLEFLANGKRAIMTIFGQGHEMHNRDCVVFGNLFVNVNVLPHPLYSMDTIGCNEFAYDLHATLFVTLVDYFEGRVFALPHPSGRQNIPQIMVEYQGGDVVKTLNGFGMRGKGALYVHFEVLMPKNVIEREAMRKQIIEARQRPR